MSERPDWLTDEQYEELRYDVLTGRDVSRERHGAVRFVFPPKLDWRQPIEDLGAFRIREVFLRARRLTSGETVLVPEWLDCEPEAQRWVPGPAAAEVFAAWCMELIAVEQCERAAWARVQDLADAHLWSRLGSRHGKEGA